jgi:hypothetical protein
MNTPFGPGAQARLQQVPHVLQIMPAAPSLHREGPTSSIAQ